MYKVKFGGKNGKTVTLQESPDMVAVRTKGNKDLKEAKLSRESRELLSDTTEVAKFPEAGISVIKMQPTISKSMAMPAPPPAPQEEPVKIGDSGFESTRGGGPAAPPPEAELAVTAEMAQRDATRAALKQEDDIRFAGRVLQDTESGEVMLYTENFFVKFLDDTSEKDCLAIIDKYHLTIKNKLPFATNAYFVEAEEGTGLEVFNIAEKILEEQKVEYCHPELVQERRFKTFLPHPLQWHLQPATINGKPVDAHANLPAAWKITRGKGVTVAVIDDGIDTDHPEFKDRVVHPFDATTNTTDARPKTEDDNHGTPCAGMACAAGLKDGACGTAPEAFLMPIRLRSGLGSMAEAQAFAWAVDHNADVISCSWGPTDGVWWDPADPTHNRQTVLPDSTRLAFEYALKKGRGGKGCVILFAAGNGNEDIQNDGYCSYPGVIAVAANNDTGTRSVYSDYGDAVWVTFPSNDFGYKPFKHNAPISEGLRTTDRTGAFGLNKADIYTNAFGGTSGACPGMAGVVALMLSANPNLTQPQIKEIIRKSCKQIDTAGGEYDANGHSPYYGYGRIDAALAVANARKAADKKNADPAMEGFVRFGVIGDMNLQSGVLINPSPARSAMGLSLKVVPESATLTMHYKANVSTLGIIENKKQGEYVGAANGRQKLLGFSIVLKGSAAKKYEIEYAARMKGGSALTTGKNGSFCGTDKKTGKPIEAIAITMKKK